VRGGGGARILPGCSARKMSGPSGWGAELSRKGTRKTSCPGPGVRGAAQLRCSKSNPERSTKGDSFRQ